ncbi:unnamed protein product [Linum trigynum]|uniref:Uncharacterized protein n=1 Tax=Linum trigynum TaxID=586398 RepID=A0AAV2GMB6_9ROSI
MEAFTRHSSRSLATAQLEPKRKMELMVERFARGTDEGCSNLDLPQPEEKFRLELAMENFERECSNMDFQPLPPPCLTLEEKVTRACASYRLSSLEESEEVKRAINENRVDQVLNVGDRERRAGEIRKSKETSKHHQNLFIGLLIEWKRNVNR